MLLLQCRASIDACSKLTTDACSKLTTLLRRFARLQGTSRHYSRQLSASKLNAATCDFCSQLSMSAASKACQTLVKHVSKRVKRATFHLCSRLSIAQAISNKDKRFKEFVPFFAFLFGLYFFSCVSCVRCWKHRHMLQTFFVVR